MSSGPVSSGVPEPDAKPTTTAQAPTGTNDDNEDVRDAKAALPAGIGEYDTNNNGENDLGELL
ncbi:MAG: hypothetical protein KTU85_11490 [Acidimicrobiia bacterium]|nr:hypothetical protein [Acidimicrobiia bacterium]